MLLMVSVAMPMLVSLTDCAALVKFRFWVAKVRVVGASVTAETTPVPLKETVCGLPAALSAIKTEAEWAPAVDGANVTRMVHNAPAVTDEPHVFVWLKSPAFAPVIVTLLTLSAAPPVLVKVMFWPELVVPTACEPNERPPVGARLTTGTVPVPLRAMDCWPPLELSEITTEAVRAP